MLASTVTGALQEQGRAKVNLTLRVVGRRADGYHDLESVVAYAECADQLALTPGHCLHKEQILETLWPEQDQTANQYFTLEERRAISRFMMNALRFSVVRPVETGRTTARHDALQFLNLGREDAFVGRIPVRVDEQVPVPLVGHDDRVLRGEGDDVVRERQHDAFGVRVVRDLVAGAAAECATVCVGFVPGSTVSKVEAFADDRESAAWLPCGATECLGTTVERAKAMFEASGPTEDAGCSPAGSPRSS